MNRITCSKAYKDLPAAHRVWNHEGHCKFIHGHNWGVKFTFSGPLDDRGFILDFGDLGWLKSSVEDLLDHTLLLSESDPLLEEFRVFFGVGLCAKVRVISSTSTEGICAHLVEGVKAYLAKHHPLVGLVSVCVTEDSKNSATYTL